MGLEDWGNDEWDRKIGRIMSGIGRKGNDEWDWKKGE